MNAKTLPLGGQWVVVMPPVLILHTDNVLARHEFVTDVGVAWSWYPRGCDPGVIALRAGTSGAADATLKAEIFASICPHEGDGAGLAV